MRKLAILKFVLILALAFIIKSLFFIPQAFASQILFQDDFNDENISDWIVKRNPCRFNGQPAQWQVVSGRIGIKINGGSCVTEIVPMNFILQDDLEYVYEVDMEFTNTVSADRNMLFRYKDQNNWYDLKFYDNKMEYQKLVAPFYRLESTTYPFQSNQTYRFAIEVLKEKIKVFIDGIKVWEIDDSVPQINNATVGLQASAGGNPSSEVWFDNIKVTGIDNILPVPYYSQNVLPWGPTEYDHANYLGFSDPDFERWGCAVTSAAMVLNYHNMTEFEDDTPIDPGSLNEWLKENNGYQTGKNKNDEPFSKFVWSSIPRLTKDLFNADKAEYKLIHNRPGPGQDKDAILKTDIMDDQIPGILGVANADTDMHFVVGKGFDENTYFINDPEWNYSTLESFNNNFFQLDRYVKSNTDFSYIEMSINEEVEILVVDPDGNKSGRIMENGVWQEYNEIPNAIYSHQNPISNPNIDDEMENLGIGFNEFLLPLPPNGEYRIILSSDNSETYTLNIATLQENGVDQNVQDEGFVEPRSSKDFSLDYSRNSESNLSEGIFDPLMEHIHDFFENGEIKNKGIYNSLLVKANGALIASVFDTELAKEMLNALFNELNAQKGKKISEAAYNILSNDIQSILSTL